MRLAGIKRWKPKAKMKRDMILADVADATNIRWHCASKTWKEQALGLHVSFISHN